MVGNTRRIWRSKANPNVPIQVSRRIFGSKLSGSIDRLTLRRVRHGCCISRERRHSVEIAKRLRSVRLPRCVGTSRFCAAGRRGCRGCAAPGRHRTSRSNAPIDAAEGNGQENEIGNKLAHQIAHPTRLPCQQRFGEMRPSKPMAQLEDKRPMSGVQAANYKSRTNSGARARPAMFSVTKPRNYETKVIINRWKPLRSHYPIWGFPFFSKRSGRSLTLEKAEILQMAVFHPHTVQCVCGNTLTVQLADSINAKRSPDTRERILRGELHRAACPACNRQMTVEKPFYYTDLSRNVLFKVCPRGERHRWKETSRELDKASTFIPGAVADTNGRTLRVIFGMDELRE